MSTIVPYSLKFRRKVRSSVCVDIAPMNSVRDARGLSSSTMEPCCWTSFGSMSVISTFMWEPIRRLLSVSSMARFAWDRLWKTNEGRLDCEKVGKVRKR